MNDKFTMRVFLNFFHCAAQYQGAIAEQEVIEKTRSDSGIMQRSGSGIMQRSGSGIMQRSDN